MGQKCVSAADCETGTTSMSVAIKIRTSVVVYLFWHMRELAKKKFRLTLIDFYDNEMENFLFRREMIVETCHERRASVNRS